MAAGAVGVRSSKSVGNQPLRFPSLSAGLPGPPESFSIVKRTASLRYKKKGQEKKNYRTSQPAETTRSKKKTKSLFIPSHSRPLRSWLNHGALRYEDWPFSEAAAGLGWPADRGYRCSSCV